jgi:hypothetical protein
MNKLLGYGLLSLSLLGCVDREPETSSTLGMSFEEFKARTFVEPGTGLYIVDWDTPVRGDDGLYKLWEATQQGALAVYNIGGQDIVWSAAQRKALTYCVGATFGANKQLVIDAMKAASDLGWEKFADVNFVYVPAQDANCTAANANVMFDVNQVNSGGTYLARSFFPNTLRADRNVLIDPNSFNPAQTGNIPLANILGHELGHTIGFRHEHIRPEANATTCVEDADFRGLTAYDKGSVMHYPQCNGIAASTLAFTALDRTGVVALYGAPVANVSPMTMINAPVNGSTQPQNFDVAASIVDSDLVKAELSMDGTLVQSLTAAPFTFHVANAAVGAHQLQVTATDSANQTTVTMVSVTVAKGTGTGGGTGTGTGPGAGTGTGDDGSDGSADISGGCQAGGGGAGLGFALGLLGLVVRRRR